MGSFLAWRNVTKVWLLLGGIAAVLLALGWWLAGVRGGGVFLLAGVLTATTIYWYGPRVVLASVGARELLLADLQHLQATVETLALRAGVERPRLHLIPDPFPRALAVGRGSYSAAIAISQGLLATATPAELEGLLAHEIAHIRHRDIVVQTPVVILAGALLELSRIGGFLQRALLFVLGPVAASVVHVLLSPKRELAADALAARLCGSPHGLADALVRLDQASELVEFGASPSTEPLYPVNPFADEGLGALFTTHPPLGERVQRLRELDPDWREKLRAA